MLNDGNCKMEYYEIIKHDCDSGAVIMGYVEHRGIGRFKRARMQPRGQVSQNFEFKIWIVECENGQRKI